MARGIILMLTAMLGASPVVWAQARSDRQSVCMDSSEARALACSQGAARRVGDTLFLRIGARERSVVDTSLGDRVRLHKYLGTLGQARAHLVRLSHNEGPWETLIIDRRSGREASVLMDPVPSPDGQRLFAVKPDWNDCQGDEPGLTVWRLTDSLPVREWQLKPNSCVAQAGWGAVEPHWRGADSIDFVRSYPLARGGYGQQPMTAVRDRHGWRLNGSRDHPVLHPPPVMPYVSEGECEGRDCAVVERVACRAFETRALTPGGNGTDVIPGDRLDVFGTVLIVEQAGVIVFDGPVSGGSPGDALPSQFQRGDTLYLLEHLAGDRWQWWWSGRPGTSRFAWLDSSGRVLPDTKATLHRAPRYTRWRTLMRLPRGTEGAEVTFVKEANGMWATSRSRCP